MFSTVEIGAGTPPTKEGSMPCGENEFSVRWSHCQVHTNQKNRNRVARKPDPEDYTLG